jgi:hypothetical protein
MEKLYKISKENAYVVEASWKNNTPIVQCFQNDFQIIGPHEYEYILKTRDGLEMTITDNDVDKLFEKVDTMLAFWKWKFNEN